MTSPLQTALAAEHAAVFVYGILGGRTSRTATPGLTAALRRGYDAHRARRDQLQTMIADAGETPVAQAPAYAAPQRIGSPDGIRRAALDLERSCAETFAWLVSQTPSTQTPSTQTPSTQTPSTQTPATQDADNTRAWAVNALADCAVRELAFGGSPETLPGISADHS